jgi:hypothetical protein
MTIPSWEVKVGFGNWILGYEIYLGFGACNMKFTLFHPIFQLVTFLDS